MVAATSPMPYEQPPPSRPLGVAILSVLLGIYGFLVFLFGLLVIAGIAVSSYLGISHFAGYGGYVLGSIVAVIGLVILGVAVGLWHLRMWALVLALIVTFVELAVNGIAGNFVSFGFIVALILFVYLLAVHRHFR